MSSRFISETEITKQRKIRQDEWEKVRSADQPLEAPEEIYDSRCLYDRLQEQKNKRDSEYEEAHKLKNMIKGLDDDEIEFLDLIDRTKMAEERKKNLEDEKEMKDYKAAVASLQKKSLDERLKHELKQPQIINKSMKLGHKNSQLQLLAGVVVKKSDKTENKPFSSIQATKIKYSEIEDTAIKDKFNKTENVIVEKNNSKILLPFENSQLQTGAFKCIAILPGLGSYDDSSDSDCSSDEQESECKQRKLDILGRQIMEPKSKEDN